jgi:hypothetical protein
MGIARNIARLVPNGSGELPATNLASNAITTPKILDANVTLAKLSASGSPSSSNFLRGDNSWQVVNQILVKAHYFTNSTRTTISNGTSNINVFSWTSSFVPVNPSTNDLYVIGVVPGVTAGQNFCNYGPRFEAGSTYDFQNIGSSYPGPGSYSAFQNYNFRIAAGTIASGTYTIYHRIYTTDSNMAVYNPNNSEGGVGGRLPQGSTSTLMILEYKNA